MEIVKRYRLWLWVITFIAFLITCLWSPNTESSWVAAPILIGSVALFFGMGGEYVILSFEIDEPLLNLGLETFFAINYVIAFAIVMAVAGFYAGLG